MLPLIATCVCARSGRGCSSSSLAPAISIPGMQKPHCTAPQPMNACCSGWVPAAPPSPSMVVIRAWWACGAGTRQLITAWPSSQTVQAPHSPSAQPSLAPVRPASWRSASSSVLPPAPGNTRRAPLIVATTVPAYGASRDGPVTASGTAPVSSSTWSGRQLAAGSPAARRPNPSATSAASVASRYAAEPRRSPIGETSPQASRPASRQTSGVSGFPNRKRSALGARTMVGARQPRAIRAARTVSPSKVRTSARLSTEMAWARRSPSLMNRPR